MKHYYLFDNRKTPIGYTASKKILKAVLFDRVESLHLPFQWASETSKFPKMPPEYEFQMSLDFGIYLTEPEEFEVASYTKDLIQELKDALGSLFIHIKESVIVFDDWEIDILIRGVLENQTFMHAVNDLYDPDSRLPYTDYLKGLELLRQLYKYMK